MALNVALLSFCVIMALAGFSVSGLLGAIYWFVLQITQSY